MLIRCGLSKLNKLLIVDCFNVLTHKNMKNFQPIGSYRSKKPLGIKVIAILLIPFAFATMWFFEVAFIKEIVVSALFVLLVLLLFLLVLKSLFIAPVRGTLHSLVVLVPFLFLGQYKPTFKSGSVEWYVISVIITVVLLLVVLVFIGMYNKGEDKTQNNNSSV
jgi:hypothetical protein